MMKRFANKTVVVTGASAGVGAATARLFAVEGARVALAARRPEPLEAVRREIDADGSVIAVPTDVADPGSAAGLLAKTAETFGAIHVLVNNAGFNQRGPFESQEVADLERVLDVNLKAPLRLMHLALPYLRRAGGGAIVNVASIAGIIPVPDEATYSASKFGLRALSFALADEFQEFGVTVSVV